MSEILKDKSLRFLLILAILLRLLLMPFFYHPDIKTTNFKVSFLKQGIFDVYSYIVNNKSKLPYPEEFNYFPLTYFFLGGYQFLASPFLGSNFDSWIQDASQNALDQVGVFRYLFILKIPYLIFDLLTAFFLYLYFDNRVLAKKIFILWLFNPFSLILIYLYSNIDIIPVCLSVWSLLLLRRNKLILSALVLGLASGFKVYPLIFLPFVLMKARSLKEVILTGLSCLGLFFIVILPFIFNQSFKDSALTSGLTTRVVTSGLSLGFGETIMPGILAIGVLVYYAFLKKGDFNDKLEVLFFSILFLLLSYVHFHIQWLLWVVPFVLLLTLGSKKLAPFLYLNLAVGVLIPLLYNDSSMTVSLYSVFSRYFESLSTPYELVQRLYDPLTLQSALHSILAGGSLVLIWQLLRKRDYE